MPSYEHICELLDRAKKHFERIGDNTLWDSRWNTGTEVAEFVRNCTNALKGNRLKQQDYETLAHLRTHLYLGRLRWRR